MATVQFLPSFSLFFPHKQQLKVLFVTTEAAPFAKVGGLGEIMRTLPAALRKRGVDARVFLPKYGSANLERFPLKKIADGLRFVSDKEDPHGLFVANILEHRLESDGGTVYFLENMEFFEKRANVYGYADDQIRWIYLSQGVLEFLRISSWVPDVIVANDWQTAFAVDFLKHQYAKDQVLSKIASVYAIHNLHFQSMHDHHFVSESDYDAGQAQIPHYNDPRLLLLNGARRGILWSDAIVAVSPTYAKEILTQDFGEGLHDLLQEKRSRLFGILNGLDYGYWNPKTDARLTANFSANTLSERAKNKRAVQEKFNLDVNPDKFLIGIVSRMDEQKGFDLIMQVAESLFDNVDFQMVAIGNGDNKYRLFFQDLEKKFPGRFGGHYSYDDVLPPLIFGGADAMLIPSRFEPCGLVQLEAMRYGSVPIVRKVGGLADSVCDFDGERGTGFVFSKFDPSALLIAVVRAREAFNNKNLWHGIVTRAMKKDFSWDRSAAEYERVLKIAVANHQ